MKNMNNLDLTGLTANDIEIVIFNWTDSSGHKTTGLKLEKTI